MLALASRSCADLTPFTGAQLGVDTAEYVRLKFNGTVSTRAFLAYALPTAEDFLEAAKATSLPPELGGVGAGADASADATAKQKRVAALLAEEMGRRASTAMSCLRCGGGGGGAEACSLRSTHRRTPFAHSLRKRLIVQELQRSDMVCLTEPAFVASRFTPLRDLDDFLSGPAVAQCPNMRKPGAPQGENPLPTADEAIQWAAHRVSVQVRGMVVVGGWADPR